MRSVASTEIGVGIRLLEELEQAEVVRRVGLKLDAGVQVLGVLADKDQIHVRVPRADALVVLAGAYAGVQVADLSKRHVDTPKSGPDRRGDRTLDADLVGEDRIDGGLGKG
jgi:hypothetical protein